MNEAENFAAGVHIVAEGWNFLKEGVQQDFVDQERTNWFRRFDNIDESGEWGTQCTLPSTRVE